MNYESELSDLMAVRLPQAFLDKMKNMLGPEYDEWFATYEQPRWYGLRVNTLKLDGERFRAMSPFGERLSPIPWAEDAYYYDEQDRPGKHPHYHAGLYYMQEPSAMAPAELLDVRPGHRVLDLCAAPGGKSTQIAAKLRGEGLLITNDNARERTKALARNIELFGVRNAVVLNEEPAALAARFGAFFDRILVDAPCSGEGMFRKDESMAAEWERHSVEKCSAMQRDILHDAAAMLAPGGKLVYSTCTFSPEENEAQIAALLDARPDLTVEPVPLDHGWSAGRPDWADGRPAGDAPGLRRGLDALAGTVRLWPHRTRGEGHYAAVLRREGGAADAPSGPLHADGADGAATPRSIAAAAGGKRAPESRRDHAARRKGGAGGGRGHGGGRAASAELEPAEAWRAFAARLLPGAGEWPGRLVAYGQRLYLQPPGTPELDGLRVVRAGWYLGDAVRGRFTPSQALAMGLRADEAVRRIELAAGEPETLKYLKGETLQLDADRLVLQGDAEPNGYALVCIDGFPAGWGKWNGGMLKNELAPGWRWM